MSLVHKYRDAIIRGFAGVFAKKKLEPTCFEKLQELVRNERNVAFMTTRRRRNANTILSPRIQALADVHPAYRIPLAKAILRAVERLEGHPELEKRWLETLGESEKEHRIMERVIKEGRYSPSLWYKVIGPTYSKILYRFKIKLQEVEEIILREVMKALEEEIRGEVQRAHH